MRIDAFTKIRSITVRFDPDVTIGRIQALLDTGILLQVTTCQTNGRRASARLSECQEIKLGEYRLETVWHNFESGELLDVQLIDSTGLPLKGLAEHVFFIELDR